MKTTTLLALAFATLSPWVASAQTTTGSAGAVQTREPRQQQPIASVVRGFYIEAKATGGYTLADQTLEAPAVGPGTPYPTLSGASEELGGVAGLQLNVGYDLTEHVAVQAVVGNMFASGRRADYVRDLSIAYGGLQARLAFDLTDRLDLLASAGVAYASASNQVEAAEKGAAVLGGIGFEYYVHVRHFSVGMEVTAFAPLSPSRVFLGLSPMIKYTF
ncbi:MAG: adventurous gliding motility protein CglE [Myxococcota bacterium]